MLMICDDESVILSPAEVHALPQIQAWVRKWTSGGSGAAERGSVQAAATVASATAVLVSDGPFAGTQRTSGRLRHHRVREPR